MTSYGPLTRWHQMVVPTANLNTYSYSDTAQPTCCKTLSSFASVLVRPRLAIAVECEPCYLAPILTILHFDEIRSALIRIFGERRLPCVVAG
jgi:hypothetical protein